MKLIHFFALPAVLILGLSGCSTSPSTSQANVQRNAANASTDPARPADTETSGPQNTEINDRSSANSRRKMTEVPANSEIAQPPAVPAPENSTITTTMASDGSVIETRIFAGDRDIDRVRKISNDRNPTAVIFLKNGSTVTAPASKMPSLKTISLAELKAVAGIGLRNSTTPNERREKGSVKP